MRKIHLFTTDESSLQLLNGLPRGSLITCIIVPENRQNSAKVERLRKVVPDVPLYLHRRGATLYRNVPRADAGVSWLYSQIINVEDIRSYPMGILNMHGGRLPEYRGANVLQWAIINGEKSLGVTWHKLVEAIDAGPIMVETVVPIGRQESAATLREKMIDTAIAAFPLAWQRFLDPRYVGRIPNLSCGKIWPPRKPADGQIGLRWTEQRVRNLVRALCPPWPPATIEYQGQWHGVASISDEPKESTIPYVTLEGRLIYLRLIDNTSS